MDAVVVMTEFVTDFITQFITQWKQTLPEVLTHLQQYLYSGQDFAAAVILLALGSVGGMMLYHMVVVNYKNHRVKKAFKRGRIAENVAVKFLRNRGYKILASQLREDVVIYVDGEAEKSIVRADYLVRRGWKLYVVEVKSGQQGNAKLPAIRRQLLEYHMVYQPDGILLLDMEHKNLQEIRFSYANDKTHTTRHNITAVLKIACILLLLVIAALMVQGQIG